MIQFTQVQANIHPPINRVHPQPLRVTLEKLRAPNTEVMCIYIFWSPKSTTKLNQLTLPNLTPLDIFPCVCMYV